MSIDSITNPKILETTNLINFSLVNEIIFLSDIKNHIDINKLSKSQIDTFLNSCLEKLLTKPKLFEQFVKESEEYTQTKYHQENLITHLYCVGLICALFSDKFNLEPDFAFMLGFFHDIGKPWAKKYIQTKKKIISNSKGHSQIGENICWELGLDKKISWCVSNHMCSCCHENNLLTHWEYVGSLQYISLDQKLSNNELMEFANSLACLMIGDDLGRLGEKLNSTEKNIPNIIAHSNTWLQWFHTYITNPNVKSDSVKFLSSLHPNDSIIIQMYGHSGFGKSFESKNIIKCKVNGNKLN
jgi:hypothetical protein